MTGVADFKTILRNAYPRNESRTTRFLAHGAVAMGNPVARQQDGKINGTTQAVSSGGCHGGPPV